MNAPCECLALTLAKPWRAHPGSTTQLHLVEQSREWTFDATLSNPGECRDTTGHRDAFLRTVYRTWNPDWDASGTLTGEEVRDHDHQLEEKARPLSTKLLTMLEVADVVRVPVATLRYWRDIGTGPRSFRSRPQRPLLAHGGLRLARRPGQWRPPERRLTSCPLPTWRHFHDRLDGRPDQLSQSIGAAAVELMRRGEDGQH